MERLIVNLGGKMKGMKQYTLKEIASWQTDITNKESNITLPSLQRGFVWKPFQIEKVWDSIFRGYPLGAIMMSVDEESDHRLLLDGQQRCTSIALGHYNPFDEENNSFLSLKDYKPSVWIDLNPSQVSVDQKFVFRCLTKSHPWGYKLKDNKSTLEMKDRKSALKYFIDEQNNKSYLLLKSNEINPWDAYYPVPLSFLLEIANEPKLCFDIFKTRLFSILENLKIRTKYTGDSFINYKEIEDSKLKKIFDGLLNYQQLLIPEIVVNSKLLKEDDIDEVENQSNNETMDPVLFVRLNSAGTNISGEELIYSIYKASFPEVKELVEAIGNTFIPPTKIINIFSKLSHIDVNKNVTGLPKDLNVKFFRERLKEPKFCDSLQQFIGTNETSKAKELISKAIHILRRERNDIPDIFIKQIIASDFDMFFVLIYFMNTNNIDKSNVNYRDIASIYQYILFFNKDKKNSSSALFDYLFIDKLSWVDSLSKLILNNLVMPIINPKLIFEHLVSIVVEKEKNYNHIDLTKDISFFNDEIKLLLKFKAEDLELFRTNWNRLIHKLNTNKLLLIFAQRSYMIEKFQEFNQLEDIEDTNRPWDWDHIYPISWVYQQRYVDDLTRNWVNANGNFRALSYDDNRSESNSLSPKQRFENDHNKNESFILDSDYKFWCKIHRKIDIENNEEKKNYLMAIITRTINIYSEWFNEFEIGNLN